MTNDSQRRGRFGKRALVSATGILVAVTLLHVGHRVVGQTGSSEPTPYRVVDGKVDASTYLGWRVFHSACHGCHGVDATGTSVAPNLVERVQDMDSKEFADVVLVRYRIVVGAGSIAGDDSTALREAFSEMVAKHERGDLIMPSWEVDPNVKPHVLDLYAYLRARADGALGPGRPERISE